MYMYSSNPALFVAVEDALCLGVLEGAARYQIHPYQHHHRHYQYYVRLPPLFPEVSQQPRLARVAVVA